MAEETPAGPSQWQYKDPDGNIQGPFLAAKLLQWFDQSYFDAQLLVSTAAASWKGMVYKLRGWDGSLLERSTVVRTCLHISDIICIMAAKLLQ